MSELTLEVQERAEKGKNANRRLRATGQVPAVVYGDNKPPVPIQVDRRSIETLLRSAGGENAVFLLKVAGGSTKRHAMIRELQTDTVYGDMVHIDFLRVDMDQKVQVSVPVEIQGEAKGVSTQGGILDFVTRELEVECLPGDIPDSLVVDVSALEIGDHLEASAVELPKGVELLDDADRMLISIHAPQLEEVTEEEDEGLIEAPTDEPKVIGQEESGD